MSGCGDDAVNAVPPGTTSSGGGGEVGNTALDCAAGEVVDSVGDCSAVGVATCPAGFVREDGGCTAIVPDGPCPEGEMALPGDTACAPVMDCGTGKWGNIPQPPGTTIYVDQSYTAVDADGSIDRPFPTIGEAVIDAPAGSTVAVTDGVYPESVLPGRALGAIQLHGRCPDRVTIAGEGQPLYGALEISENATGTLVSGFSITNPVAFGITVSGVENVVLENLWVHDTFHAGVAADNQLGTTSLSLRRVLFQRVQGGGVVTRGMTLDVDGIEVRDGIADAAGAGVGISLIDFNGQPSVGTVTRAFIHDTVGAGIGMQGSSLSLTASLIRDVSSIQGTLEDGMGIAVLEGSAPELTLDGVVIEQVRDAGVIVTNATAVVRNTTVRDVQPQEADGRGGVALAITTDGLVPPFALLHVEDCMLERATGFGVYAVDAETRVARTWIRQSSPLADNALFGDGVIVLAFNREALGTVEQVAIEDNARAGLSNFGANVVVQGSRLTCNAFDLNGEGTERGNFSYDDLGGNYCGCGELMPCRVATSNLELPSLP